MYNVTSYQSEDHISLFSRQVLATSNNLVSSKPTAPFFIMPKSLKAISSKKSAASLVTIARTNTFSEAFQSASSFVISGFFVDMMSFVFMSIVIFLCLATYINVWYCNRATETFIRDGVLCLYNKTTRHWGLVNSYWISIRRATCFFPRPSPPTTIVGENKNPVGGEKL